MVATFQFNRQAVKTEWHAFNLIFLGDGKLGGIVKPNDGLCHLDRNTPATYTHSTEQDYPSVSQVQILIKLGFRFTWVPTVNIMQKISVHLPEICLRFQINHKVKENSVNLIFAVTEEQFSVYNLLKENIEGSSAGTLTNDSSNIVQLVKEQYQVH